MYLSYFSTITQDIDKAVCVQQGCLQLDLISKKNHSIKHKRIDSQLRNFSGSSHCRYDTNIPTYTVLSRDMFKRALFLETPQKSAQQLYHTFSGKLTMRLRC